MPRTSTDHFRLLDALLPTGAHKETYHSDPEFHLLVDSLARAMAATVDWSPTQAPERAERSAKIRRILDEGPLATGGGIPEGSTARHIEDDDGRT